jgi:uncharacterized protein (TIRG00374 family)
MNDKINSAFSGWKIALAVGIGLLITSWMFYRSMTDVRFTEVGSGGTHEWVDGNKNDRVDLSDKKDFKQSKDGTYVVQTVSRSLKEINWTSHTIIWLFAAILFTAGRDFFYMVRIRLLTKNRLRWKASFYVIMLWEFASALSPGVVGGAAVAMFILNREGIPFGKATAIVIITAFMDNLFYVVMIPLVLLFINHTDLISNGAEASLFLAWWFWVGFGVILFLCVLLYLTIFWYPKLATNFLLFIFKLPFLNKYRVVALEWGKDIETASRKFKKEKRHYWFKVFLATFGSWISRYLVINAILTAFLNFGFIENMKVLGKQLVLWLFMLVSPTPGGSGVAEYAFGELLSDFSSSALLLAMLALIWRLISYFPYLLIGSLLLPSWIRRTS